MSDCQKFKDLLEQYVAGEAARSDLGALLDHARSCAECGQLIEMHEELSLAVDEVPEPSNAHFRAMRAAVLRQIPRKDEAKAARTKVWGEFWRGLWAHPAGRPAFAFILALAFLGAGFLIGRSSAPAPGFDERLMVNEINRHASLERGLEGYWDSPFVYSNVKFRPRNGVVAVSFDVARHVELETTADSPLLRDVMVHAMLDPSAVGSRLEAIGLAPRSMDGKMREVLTFTLLNDPSLPVRLKAVEILTQYASDSGVQDALLKSLGQDPSVQVRLLALECLAGQKVDPGVIRSAIGQVNEEADRAVFQRAVELTGAL
jgi:hypothetical protein